ncbi:flagellar hook-basal body complex protein [Arcobacter sp. L]|uniref:flagellar hook-basal body complex protein n=1 Tax=Arcobacter sp. L TaxID=944547 RepID=UPI0002295FBC|nr:flagellar hook-basal body complex protein [Arcobacter sp. L]BAK74265.1 flagellar hook protein FlgE [Arcobacter sp. L]
MIGALWNGMSGISTYDKAISVESNNVSNVNTVGHKLDNITFEDMLYKSGYGKGVGTQSIDKQFTQGNIKPTNVNLDVAIEGDGFFVVSQRTNGDIFYTRAGDFQQAEDGLLETQDHMKVLGLTPQNRTVISSDVADNIFSNEFSKNLASIDVNSNKTVYNINARATDYYTSAVDDTENGNNYKTASSKINDVEMMISDYVEKLKLFQSNPDAQSLSSTTQSSQVNFSSQLTQLVDENDYLSVTINNSLIRQNFDTDIETTLKKLSDKISNIQGLTSNVDFNSGVLNIQGMVPGKEFNLVDATVNNEFVNVTKVQNAILGSGLSMVESSRNALKTAIENAGAKFLEISNILAYGDNSVIGSNEINLRLNALGLVQDVKGDISISDDGFVYVSNNNNDFLVGKIDTAGFKNVQGLSAAGGNNYSVTKESGVAFNANDLNKVIPNSLENANVNFGNTLSTLLIYQKAFEANSKSITTSDDFIKTAIDMIK